MPSKITTYDELLDWSKRANFCVDLKEKIQLQDECGYSYAKVIEKLWEESVERGDRNLVCFALHKIMGDDYLARYIDVWIQVKQSKSIMELSILEMEMNKKIQFKQEDLQVARKSVAKRVRQVMHLLRKKDWTIQNQEKYIKELQDDNKKLRNSLGGAMDQAGKYEHYADRYFDMLSMLNTLQEDMMQRKLGALK